MFPRKSYLIQLKAVTSFYRRRNEGKNAQKIGDDPTMLMKTKENQSDILDGPTMFMKTNNLIFRNHDVDDNKRT